MGQYHLKSLPCSRCSVVTTNRRSQNRNRLCDSCIDLSQIKGENRRNMKSIFKQWLDFQSIYYLTAINFNNYRSTLEVLENGSKHTKAKSISY